MLSAEELSLFDLPAGSQKTEDTSFDFGANAAPQIAEKTYTAAVLPPDAPADNAALEPPKKGAKKETPPAYFPPPDTMESVSASAPVSATYQTQQVIQFELGPKTLAILERLLAK